MLIEFDEKKRAASLVARNLDMVRADEVFAGTTVVLVWTPRGGVYRVISMRKANERERSLYGPRF